MIIGNYTSIADEVHILLGGDHPTHWVSTFPLRIKLGLPGAGRDGTPSTKGDVVIGSDVWIGLGVTILSGVHIGDGAIIMARSVIVKDVEPYAIVGGVPGRLVRKRFDGEDIEKLLNLKWWEWPDQQVVEATPMLSSGDIDSFLKVYASPSANTVLKRDR
ncbi:CatB-related O-acetyltransferase [Geothrix sp. PMB-07]|uniref:CatB-related O-acetyltransferase n=1 Tax=Geothrix sp. PMB-07 TaxID=3068640 RepID=UPI002740BAD8|nr:CatB-related O-acetyltransferase [Geothrix sp. PMB-07]WLT31329.1 CatB-related O-acetyltransferase [Geothrix sp. PMB-07]